jgi:hypothetical protein
MTTQGGCLCSAVRYEISAPPLVSIACHCRACQYVAGGAPTLVMAFPKSAVTITKGAAKTFWSTADSGAKVGRSFCHACGTPLFAAPEHNADFVAVKVGSLDDPSGFKVQLDIWRRTAQPWHARHEGATQFEENPRRP